MPEPKLLDKVREELRSKHLSHEISFSNFSLFFSKAGFQLFLFKKTALSHGVNSKRTEAAYTNWIKRFDFLHLNQNLRTEQKNVSRYNITMIYTHVIKTEIGVKSPKENLI